MRDLAAVCDLVDLVTEKHFAARALELPYVGLEHIAPRAAVLDRAGSTEGIVGICNRFAPGDILFGKLRPNLRKCVQADRNGLCSTEILVLRPRDGHDPRFVAQVVRSEQVFRIAESATEGTKMPRTSWGILSKIRLFAPSPDEQRALADVLDAVDAAIRETEALIAKLKVLRLGLIEDLLMRGIDKNGEVRDCDKSCDHFSDAMGLGLPPSWRVACLRDIVSDVYRYPTYFNIQYVSSGVPEIRGELIKEDGFLEPNLMKYRFISENTASRFSRVRLKQGDVVMTVRGTLGKVALVPCWLEGGVPTANVLRIRLNLLKAAPEWVLLFLCSRLFRDALESATSATTINTIQVPSLTAIKLRLPPVPEQRHVARLAGAMNERICGERLKRDSLIGVRDGLRDDLLTGRVRVAAAAEAAV